MGEEILLTQEGFDKLEAERDELVSVKRREVSERLKEAISYGDLSENAEFDAARNEQAELEEKIHKLENMIRNAKIINEEELSGDTANVGLVVKVKNLDTKEVELFELVGATESDPFCEPAKISNESPMGKAMIGKKKGEKFNVETPDGEMSYKIQDINKIDG
ncbi:transcription elongation factor GreA [Eubacteriales bacterium KG127]